MAFRCRTERCRSVDYGCRQIQPDSSVHWKNVPAASSILVLKQGEVRRTLGLSGLSKSEVNDYADQSVP